MEEEFRTALRYVTDPNAPPLSTTNEQKLEFYALFKQSTEGPPKGSPPSRLKVVERAKYMAWKAKAKLSKNDAQRAYIELLNKVAPTWRVRSKL
mmetsp:Transcript_26605/g.47830  ORF Transcript_26605/g.47830 Transcript_26605/m.47830 type:complete len:94 (+) Transcript_26605:2355-2636(+)